MRVRSISVRKLFGRFNHTISLNLGERITIIHGPNGFGKTALLRLVHAAFHFDVATLLTIPFEALHVELSDSLYLHLSPKARHSVSGKSSICYTLGRGEQALASDFWTDDASNSLLDPWVVERYKAASQTLSRVPSAEEFLSILQQERRVDASRLFTRLWLALTPVHMISVQRLLTPNREKDFLPLLNKNRTTFDQTVTVYSDELRAFLDKARGEYLSTSQNIDATFPLRILEIMDRSPISDEDLNFLFKELEKTNRQLDVLFSFPSTSGLLGASAITDDAMRKVIWLYLRDTIEKLTPFEWLAERVGLLQEIINHRFQFKRLRIDAERGFVFESDIGQELPATALSSGEQHQLVMVYECLFKIQQDALLLIDEPELSLHVSWQVEFLHDLQRIIEIARFDVLIATHSPQIIHDRWDLTVELQPPSESPAAMSSEVPAAEQGAALE